MVTFQRGPWLELVVLILAFGFWFAAVPISQSRDLSPEELIQNAMPGKATMKSASKPDFFNAICGAVRKNRKSGAGITATAIAARGEWAGEIVGTVLRCARNVDCEYVGAIVSAAVKARAAAGPAISDAAIARAPNCGETIQAAIRAAAPAGETASTETKPGEEEKFDPHEPLRLVCENGDQRTVRESQVEEFLRTHPGSFVGLCPPTPSPSPSPSAAPNPAPALTPTPTPRD